ncbi:MAG: ParB/RepB/Spo0J family partition protein [Planctomycetales bacterium]|nr:ParB/RepB/Spo0J family partition protein [Planctomycetales bacterium]
MSRERRLGRGLASLLGESNDAAEQDLSPPAPRLHDPDGLAAMDRSPTSPTHGGAESKPTVSNDDGPKDGDSVTLSVYEIEDNPYQPRRDFSESEIVSLSESLKEHDMLQPVLVRRVGKRWQLISGERRLRAAIHAGWTTIPARVRQADDRLVAELAIVENLQRKDLNPIEKALSFRRYLDEHKCTQEDLGKRLKIDRSTIANLVRLLELPQQVQEYLQSGSISAGHARAILPLGDEQAQIDFADEILRDGLSVRATERMVQERVQAEDDPLGSTTKKTRKPRTQSPQIASLEQQLRIALGTRVDIKQTTRKRGQIVVHFRSPEEFERLVEVITENDASELDSYAG